MSTSPPLTVLLATAVATLLLAVSSVSPAAAAISGGGRMVFVHGGTTGTKKVIGGAPGNEWRHFLARLEDEVAPEFIGGILATNSRGGSISNGALNRNRPGCQSGNQCAAKGGGGSYTRPCTFKNMCPHGP